MLTFWAVQSWKFAIFGQSFRIWTWFLKHIGGYTHANFQLSRLIFVGDSFFMKIRFENINILADFDKKSTALKGQKILKNQNFKNCCIEYLNHLSICLQNQNWHFWTIRFFKKTPFKRQKFAIFQKVWFFLYLIVWPSL